MPRIERTLTWESIDPEFRKTLDLSNGCVKLLTFTGQWSERAFGFDNDAIMTDEWDCGTFFGGLGAYPSNDPDGKSRYGPNSSCTGIDGRGESCGDHGPNCTTNECDNRFPRSFGPVPSNNVTPVSRSSPMSSS